MELTESYFLGLPHQPSRRSVSAPQGSLQSREDGGWNLAHHPKDNKVTGTFLSRTPQEVVHKGSQGNSTPGRAFLHPHRPLLPKGQPHLPGSSRNREGGLYPG